ncbi:MAG: hypothetical protein Q9168_005633, partial [Polycauliona sp. 1 TL-2023]
NSAAYWKAIDAHAGQTTLQTLYPPQGYEELRTFLARPPLAPRHANHRNNDTNDVPHAAILYTIDNEVKPDVCQYNDSDALLNHMAANFTASKAQIVFLKGYPSPEWVTGVGALFQIDPEIFKLFLQFRDRKDYHATHCLPSFLDQILRIRICTVGSREEKTGASDQAKVDKARSVASKAKTKFPQSAALLAEHYAECVDMQLLGNDPFYALTELFQVAANGESQLFAAIESKIGAETRFGTTNGQ